MNANDVLKKIIEKKELNSEELTKLVQALLLSHDGAAEKKLKISSRRVRTLVDEKKKLTVPVEGTKAILHRSVEDYKNSPNQKKHRPKTTRSGNKG